MSTYVITPREGSSREVEVPSNAILSFQPGMGAVCFIDGASDTPLAMFSGISGCYLKDKVTVK